jgi:hypothetical protein
VSGADDLGEGVSIVRAVIRTFVSAVREIGLLTTACVTATPTEDDLDEDGDGEGDAS